MADEKKASQKALARAYERTEAGMAQLLHAQLYFKYVPLYIYHMRDGINKFLEEPVENIRPTGEDFDEVEELVRVLVNHTGAKAADPDTNVYHAKVLRKEDATQILSLQEDLDLGDLPKSIMPYEQARRVLIQNPENLAVIDCVCRTLRGEAGCYPRDVCILVGDPWVDWVLARDTHMNAHRVTQQEALDILDAAHARGDVHAAFFKDAAAGRFYHICNCCSCCCTALATQNNLGVPMFAGSGYVAQIDAEKCVDCGTCADACNFTAITKNEDGGVSLNETLCQGCEACAGKCAAGAITFAAPDTATLAPLDLRALAR